MNDRLSSLPPYTGDPELAPAPLGCRRVLSRVLCGLGGAVLGFMGGAFGCVGLCPAPFSPDGNAMELAALVYLITGLTGAALGARIGVRFG